MHKDYSRDKLLEMGPYPNSWPRWPILPVKSRTKKKGHLPQLGYVTDPETVKIGEYIVVRDGNIFAPNNDDPVLDRYDSWQAMVDDGWVVD